MAEVCSIEGCGKAPRSRGWCAAHYERWRKHGDPFVILKAVSCKRLGVDAGGVPCCQHGQMSSRGGGRWQCKKRAQINKASWYAANCEKIKAINAARYANLSGPAYNRLLLLHRRTQALARVKKRHQTKERVDG